MADNLNPSTAYLDERGNYIADPLNQPLAYAERSAHDNGQKVHPVKPGYCEAHLRLGCEECSKADMTPLEAVKRLENRDQYLSRRIEEAEAKGVETFWFHKDREALALAISALQYLDQVIEYEKSQITT